MPETDASFRLRQVLAFAAVYVIWGSTYVAIRFAIETIPVFASAGLRFVIAGSILYAWSRLRGEARPTLRHWRSATIIGSLLLLGGNGAVSWAEQHLSSGLVALLVGTEPLMVVLILTVLPGGARPSARTFLGLLLGFAGAAMLALKAENMGGTAPHLPSVAVVLLGCLAWASGSLYGRKAELPRSPALATAMNMIAGGAVLLVASTARGEWRGFDPGSVSWQSLAAFGYLVFFGAIVAYPAYLWLVRTTEPTLVATYAYVNPAVAVLLGWLLAGEPISAVTLAAMVLILLAVAIVSTAAHQRAIPRRAPARPVPAPSAGAAGPRPEARDGYPLEKCA